MILKNKGITDNTALKIVAKVLRNNPKATKGFKVKTLSKSTVVVTYEELVQFVEDLANEISKGNYAELTKCKTCGNFSYPGKKGSKGCCFPKNFTSFRKVDDHCSQWVPMTEDQRYTRRKLYEQSGQLQTKRAGNGSKNSKKST